MAAHNKNYHEKTAPGERVRDDFREISAQTFLRTSWDVQQFIIIDAVTAHSHMGHGAFRGREYRNTTEDDIVWALRMNPHAVRQDRQTLINEIKDYAVRAAEGRADGCLVNEDGEPLLRIGTFRHLDGDPSGILKGIYLGGLRDDTLIRQESEKRYHISIGSGKMYQVNRRVLHELHMDGGDLAHKEHADKIEEFKRIGLIAEEQSDETSYMFIRHTTGSGQSDDAAIVFAGRLFGYSAALGVFLADAIDTLEKYAVGNGNQDVKFAFELESRYKDAGLNREEAYHLTYLASIPKEHSSFIPDSSLRELLEIDRKHDICPIESHLLHIKGREMPEIELDRGQTTNHEFYEWIDKRLG